MGNNDNGMGNNNNGMGNNNNDMGNNDNGMGNNDNVANDIRQWGIVNRIEWRDSVIEFNKLIKNEEIQQ